MTDPLAGFISAILANPGDTATRMILADWLEENSLPADQFGIGSLREPGKWVIHYRDVGGMIQSELRWAAAILTVTIGDIGNKDMLSVACMDRPSHSPGLIAQQTRFEASQDTGWRWWCGECVWQSRMGQALQPDFTLRYLANYSPPLIRDPRRAIITSFT